MIAVDTSALMAIVLGEAEADACIRVLATEFRILISAGTLAEALIVAARRHVAIEMAALIDGLGLEVMPATEPTAKRISAAYDRWGEGVHPASLNFGDCFAYALAQENNCPLLFVGDDFRRTDVQPAI